MTCDPQAISTFTSGELSGATQRRMEAHLAECATCRGLAAEYGHVRALIKGLPTQSVPPAVETELRRALERGEMGSGWLPPFRAARMVASLAAVLAVAVLAGYVAFRQGMTTAGPQPMVVESEARTEEAPESGELVVVRIVFDRPMNQTSVAGAINIAPAAPTSEPSFKDQDRVVEIPVKPERDTTYKITVEHTARDSEGNSLKQPYVMEITTDPTGPVVVLRSPRATATAPAAAAPSSTPTAPATLSPSSTPTAPARVSPSPTSPSFVIVARTESPVTPTVTATAEAPRSTTATPSPTPTWRPATVSTATLGLPAPTAIRTVTPTVTATPVCSAPTGTFARLYAESSAIRAALGCPVQPEQEIAGASQAFEHGDMLWREDTRRLYVLRTSGRWTEHADTWKEGDPVAGEGVPPLGLYKPIRGFGKLWAEQPGIRDALGWASEPERGFPSAVQQFARGGMLLDDQGWIYLLFLDGTWQKLRQRAD